MFYVKRQLVILSSTDRSTINLIYTTEEILSRLAEATLGSLKYSNSTTCETFSFCLQNCCFQFLQGIQRMRNTITKKIENSTQHRRRRESLESRESRESEESRKSQTQNGSLVLVFRWQPVRGAPRAKISNCRIAEQQNYRNS